MSEPKRPTLATAVIYRDPKAALAWLERNQPPTAILLNLLMLEADGFRFLHELRTRPASRGVPVLVLIAKAPSAAECAKLEAATPREVVTQRMVTDGPGAHPDVSTRGDRHVHDHRSARHHRGTHLEAPRVVEAGPSTAVG